ncbi:LynF/TruF/PatF family peptide O-prenyltransferase [Limnoraphis robusta]|uniref:LynF/TruF/PatF family peptide O-prenyltransferase n=1 Tax=Limnoraphis robusta CCNP1315 TaxID=3110306 RepID=A0ABU5TY77_9CYAN|nr:LynF/TruF/PatF family peptide O-prenyltransferase [Limnoraphis robusta]MEA5500196.1 LynF/TruF/PatF family peptide O-prenyltransferase [Limnoraphis robusta BA-68 BA1]MEA5519909.1 LynF/TruF/PatF family peptide O-prenyltransferase [Limnoraphis robusta CCNP1315]MEA5545149.1 LynF/TruF/PatF family peptide O-prenyltransferase [Limnoraphis robusta CCNP1324]
MTINSRFQQNNLREQRLQFMRGHQYFFDVTPDFPLPLFEKLVVELEGSSIVELSCKVQEDRLLAGRFLIFSDQIFSNQENFWHKSLVQALNFLDSIESRVGVQINRSSLQQFLAAHITSGKIIGVTIGLDLRPELKDSSAKIHIMVSENSEDLVSMAIALDGGYYPLELVQTILKDCRMIGFDFFLNGHSEVELYTYSSRKKDGLHNNQGKSTRSYIRKNFSQKVSSLLDASDFFMAGFSRANVSPVLYFGFDDLRDVKEHFLFNVLGDRVYDFCRSQDSITITWIGVTEQDLEVNRLDDFRIYYRRNFA